MSEFERAAKASAKICSDSDLLAWIDSHIRLPSPATDRLLPILLEEKFHRNLHDQKAT